MRVVRAIDARVRRYPLTGWFLLVVAVFSVAFAVAFRQIHETAERNHRLAVTNRQLVQEARALARQDCLNNQSSWDSRRVAFVELTTPPRFTPTTDAERQGAEDAIRTELARQRRVLIATLGARPVCPGE